MLHSRAFLFLFLYYILFLFYFFELRLKITTEHSHFCQLEWWHRGNFRKSKGMLNKYLYSC